MTVVRCRTCYWMGNRKTEAPIDSELPKPCPNGHPVVVGSWPPSAVETTPSGFEIAFWDSENIESGQPQQRRYLVNGEKFPSVTTLLRILDKSDALIPWAIRLEREGLDWRDERDKAGTRGQATHQLVLDVLLGRQRRLSSLDDEHRAYGQGAMKWLANVRPEVIEAERMVASVERRFSGRFDLFAQIEGRRPLVDFKTTGEWKYRDGKRLPPYAENVLQLDLYSGAMVESGYPLPDYGLIVRLGPDGTYDETPVELDFDRGLRIIGAYDSRREANRALNAGLRPELKVAA